MSIGWGLRKSLVRIWCKSVKVYLFLPGVYKFTPKNVKAYKRLRAAGAQKVRHLASSCVMTIQIYP